ncbi:MAG: hypothetical protein ABIH23_33525, partial [bacterium]
PGAGSGRLLVDKVCVYPWYALGPAVEGGVGFRLIAGRSIKVDDVRFYRIQEDGTEISIFEDNFNRSELGEEWINESLTGGEPVGALNPRIEEGVLVLEHDGSLNDTWLRTRRSLPLGEETTVFEFTLVERFGNISDQTLSIVLGTEPYTANETIGPLMLDGVEPSWSGARYPGSPGRMDAREGNVWVAQGPLPSAAISILVNSDGRSGTILSNGLHLRDWTFAEDEPCISEGSVGIHDPRDTPGQNPGMGLYDNVRVKRISETSVTDWMLH